MTNSLNPVEHIEREYDQWCRSYGKYSWGHKYWFELIRDMWKVIKYLKKQLEKFKGEK